MAQSPAEINPNDSLEDYLKNWDALSSMLTRGKSFSGRERNCCFLNLGTSNGKLNRFADVSAVSGLDFIDDSRAVIATDWDHDGDLDLWQTNREGPRLRFVKNQLKQGRQWIAFQLTGTTSNRDAIGAVLEVKTGDQKITRTLTAGDGFMSQTSKRIHFGLGQSADSLVSVTVRWPGGAPETFDKLQPGSAYQLNQGQGIATKLTAPKVAIKLEEEAPIPPLPTEQARIILSHRIPSPPLDYVDFQGNLQKHEPGTKEKPQPVLINLWASWCPNCRNELANLKAHHQELNAKGLKILALTIEGVPQGNAQPDVTGAKKLVKSSSFPFQVGATDQNGLRLLTILHDRVIARQRALPLPASFLIDHEGKLAAIYKGPVSSKQLLADLDLLEAGPDLISSQAFPFPGRDGTNLFPLGSLDFAKAYLAGGDPSTARKEAIKVTDAPLTNNAEADLARRAQAWYFLGTLEQGLRNWKAAADAYQSALDFSPGQVAFQIPLGVSLWQAGKKEEAHKVFMQTAATGAKNPAILDALGKAHLQIKQYPEAISFFEKAIHLSPNESRYQLSLALAYQTGGPSAKAVELYEKLLEADPSSANLKNNLALILATAPEGDVRDGPRALTLAREVIAQAGEGHPSPLDSLAAAHAENGDFKNAEVAIQKALDVARAIGRVDLLPKLQGKLDLYRDRSPYRATQ